MTAAELPTVGYLDQWFRALLARVEAQQAAATPAPATVVLYSVGSLAEVLDCDPSTVRRWLREGKQVKDKKGNDNTIKLQAYYFSSEARIPWPALLAYERGEAFDLASLPAPTAAPPRPGTVAEVPARPEAPPLRLAS
ncbi:hypothetical protein GO988_15940 [Hymenobacter sp. HMF4947]|uniref:Uncharacterized protein n=1 Tax=Hymenobacter ginkgonis TaxID=2682976 RepID=A0A7K1THI4_9BACT|nr:hypothetical protein [Hymenobacter ginkgonis]MVN77823.1 hypothetical protein [Hymenobacter ginkgonis]